MEQRMDFEDKDITKADREALARVPPELRPCKILYFYNRHCVRQKKVPDWNAGIKVLAQEVQLSEERVRQICEGFAPTSYEIDRICRRKRWSIFFLFGVRKEALKNRRAQFFTAMGVQNPTRKQEKEFDELYARLLKSLAPQGEEAR